MQQGATESEDSWEPCRIDATQETRWHTDMLDVQLSATVRACVPLRLKVRGRNELGWGPWGAPSAPITPRGSRPEPPLLEGCHRPTADGRFVLEWSAPADDGGATVTMYEVDFETNMNRGHWAVLSTGPETSCAVHQVLSAPARPGPALRAGVKYSLRVRARNSVGWSVPSAVVSTSWPGEPPSAVSALRLAGTAPYGIGGEIVLAWDAPESDGGFDVKSFDVRQSAANT